MNGNSLRNVDVSLLNTEESVEVFRTLECPTFAEMNGEFRGRMLSFPTLGTKLYWGVVSKNPFFPGIWQGKSFRQTGAEAGRGYNSTRRVLAGKVDIYPMLTRIGPSFFDGKPSFQLVYHAFNHFCGDLHMLDEVRKLDDGRYLGIGRCGRSVADRRRPMPFMLVGPVGPYRTDVGRPRPGFDMARELDFLEFPKQGD